VTQLYPRTLSSLLVASYDSQSYGGGILEVEVNLRPTVSRPVCLGVGIPSGAHDQIYIVSLTIADFLTWGTSMTRGWVCNLLVQLLLGLCQNSHSRVEVPQNSRPILPSHLRLPQPGGPGPRIYIPQEQGGLVIPPGTGLPLLSPLTTRRTMVEVF
jgi:hypothetical protein